MYGEKQIISPKSENPSGTQTNGIPNTPPPPFTPLTPKKTIIKTDILDLISLFVGFFATYFLIAFVFEMRDFGVTLTYLAFLGFTTVYVVIKQKHFPLKAVFPLCLCILTAVCYSFHSLSFISPAIPFLFYLSGLYCMTLTKTKHAEFDGYISIYEQLKAILFIPLSKLFLPLSSLWNNRRSFKTKKSTVGVLVGILCGIPVFILVANLLIEGDAAFSQVMVGFKDKSEELFDKIFGDVFDYINPFYLVASLIFAPYIVSTVFSFRHGIVAEKIEKSKTQETLQNFRFVSTGILGGFYGVVTLCYVLYLVSQFSYLFGAFSGEVPLGISIPLSEYARRGFFEMSAVAFINLCLIGAGAILSKRDEKDNLPKLYKIFSVFFCLFTILLIVTAMSKMGLYITELGLTHKRILVSLADIILLVTFICVLIKIFKDSFPYMKITMYTALILIVLYFAVSPDFMISRFNTYAYLSGYHQTIDLETLTFLDDSYESAMAFDRLTQSKNEVVSAFAKNELYDYYRLYIETDYTDANGYSDNFSSRRLHKFLTENAERIKEYEKFRYYDVHYEYDIDKLMEDAQKYGLYELKTTDFTFSINSAKIIDSIYINNPYSSTELSGYEVEDMRSMTLEWRYSTNPQEDFAVIEIEADSDIQQLKIKLPKSETDKNSDTVTYITKDSFIFELRDSENGGFMLVEV